MKLHLGCGKRFIPGGVHVDVVPWPHVQYVHSIDNLTMIGAGEAEVVYACHVLGHFAGDEVNRVLREWHRVLTPGGTLRLAVPDFAALVELYQKTGDLGLVHGPLMGRGDYLYNVHRVVYDEHKLKCVLLAAGFASVRRYDRWATEHAEVDDFSAAYHPYMDRNGLLLSLNMEATKP
jgi:predicted SAM-dependent methyltransferase